MAVKTEDKNWFLDLYDDLKDFLMDILKEVFEFIKDIALNVFELLLQGVVFVLSSIPVPDFLTTGIDTLASGLHPSVLWMLGQTGFAQGLAIFGAGVMFRMTRKVFTLGQW
jgi:hypothetical protein